MCWLYVQLNFIISIDLASFFTSNFVKKDWKHLSLFYEFNYMLSTSIWKFKYYLYQYISDCTSEKHKNIIIIIFILNR